MGGTENNFGATANDLDDPDTGANTLQNFPVIASARRGNTTNLTSISGTLNSNPSQSFTIKCFVAAQDPSGHGEGQTPAGEATVTDNDGDGDGGVSFSCGSTAPQSGQTVTATATNTATGDTSEFSQIVGVVPGP